MAEDIKGRELNEEARGIHAELVDLLRALVPSKDEAEERERLQENAQTLVEAVRREMSRTCSGEVFGAFVNLLVPPEREVEAEVRAVHRVVAPMSIKVSAKVKKVLVHVLKWWVSRGAERLRNSELQLPGAHAERFVGEVCQSKLILPVLGKLIYPYFSRSQLDFSLIASILQVKICDSMLDLFVGGKRRTPELPVRLSYSEVLDNGDGVEDADEVDWSDVDFDEEPVEGVSTDVEIVFAGNRYFDAWSHNLGNFYVRNSGGRVTASADDPRVQQLMAALKQAEQVDVGTL